MKPEYSVANDFVFREGEIGNAMFFLVTGMVEVLGEHEGKIVRYSVLQQVGTTDSLTCTETNELEKGAFFGEIAVLMPVRRTASVRALTPCSFFSLTIDAFETIRSYYPTIARSIMRMISSTIDKVSHL